MFEIEEKLIDEIRELLDQLEANFVLKNEVNVEIREKLLEKFKKLPNGDLILVEFEKIFAKISQDVQDNAQKASTRPKRNARLALTPQQPEIERKQTCVELFADFGTFFSRSISKVGFKYCSESEIVRRSEVAQVMPGGQRSMAEN